MVDVVEHYMREEITAFQFDDTLTKIRCETSDETVNHGAEAVWFHYDDLMDRLDSGVVFGRIRNQVNSTTCRFKPGKVRQRTGHRQPAWAS